MSKLLTVDLEGMELFAKILAKNLNVGDLLFLEGPLGAGKTTLVKMVCRELGIEERVVSPTYSIVNRYEGNPKINHIDGYRLNGELDSSFWYEELGDSITFVEWPLNLNNRMEYSLYLNLKYSEISDHREIEIKFKDIERGEKFWDEYINN